MKTNKIPRKIKKELKKIIISRIDSAWKPKEVLITSITKPRYKDNRPTFRNFTVSGYNLG